MAAACGGFEGNAQSLRLLTRLEAKVPGAGLNLTRATLDAAIKYPWLGRPGAAQVRRLRGRRRGVRLDPRRRAARPPCLEAQVMDWADDVAYSVHDLEDGLHAGLITLAALGDPGGAEGRHELTAAVLRPGVGRRRTMAEGRDLFALAVLAGGSDGGPRPWPR